MRKARRAPVLVATDFSKASVAAVDHAAELARLMEAPVVVLHVVEPVYPMAPEAVYAQPALSETLRVEQERAAEASLARVVERLRKAGVAAEARIETGTPWDRIVRAADRLRARLLVVGTHGRTGLTRLFVGSVAEKVVRAAHVPVLTVRSGRPRARRGKR